MNKPKQVQLLMDDERRLSVRAEDGTLYHLFIFNGGGYYTDFMLQTDAEVAESTARRKEREQEERDHLQKLAESDNSRPWWKFW